MADTLPDYMILSFPDPHDDEVFIFDCGGKKEMEKKFETMVTEGHDDLFTLVKVVRFCEVVEGNNQNVVELGEEHGV